MDNKAQVSIEYLIMVGVGVIIAAVAILLATNLLALKDGIKTIIETYRDRSLQIGK